MKKKKSRRTDQPRDTVQTVGTAGDVVGIERDRQDDLHHGNRGDRLKYTAEPRQRHRQDQSRDHAGQRTAKHGDQSRNAGAKDQKAGGIGTDRGKARGRNREHAGAQHDILAQGEPAIENDEIKERKIAEHEIDHSRATRCSFRKVPKKPVGRTSSTTKRMEKMIASLNPDDT